MIAHEKYLESQARRLANKLWYTDQIEICNGKTRPASTNNVRIVIDEQDFLTTYGYKEGSCWEALAFNPHPETIELSVERNTLMLCSTFAAELFTFEPDNDEIHLPVRYPRRHDSGSQAPDPAASHGEGNVVMDNKRYTSKIEDQMAFIRRDEIEKYIVPWLEKVEKFVFDSKKKAASKKKQVDQENSETSQSHEAPGIPNKSLNRKKRIKKLMKDDPDGGESFYMPIPETLVEKIHLYNAMLQLGLPKFVQQPLVDALILHMYKTDLKLCHLDLLEMTLGRFYSRGVAVLDPVLCHLIGTYAFRTIDDRKKPKPPPSARHTGPPREFDPDAPEVKENAGDPKREDDAYEGPTNFRKTKRKYLDYAEEPAIERTDFPGDTFIMPPELPVIGHSIRHWSGVRQNGSTAAAHTGFPLNVGRSKKFVRRDAVDAIHGDDVIEEETNRLKDVEYYWANRPGRPIIDVDALPGPASVHNPGGNDDE